MHWGWQYGDWWMMGIGMLIWLVAVGVVVWLIVRATSRDRSEPRGDAAEETLRRRFAAGEIDTEEFEQRLEALRRR